MDLFSIGLSGLQAASRSQGATANNIANALTDGYQAKRVDRSELPQGGVQADHVTLSQEATVPGGSNVDYAREFTQSSIDGVAYKANLKVIQAADDQLGSVLDLKS